MHITKALPLTLLTITALLGGCGPSGDSNGTQGVVDPADDIGIGPIKSVKLDDIDEAMAAAGKQVFIEKCSACHKIEKRYTGPALAGVTERRRPEWIMNMILNPEVMLKENEAAKQLLAEYIAPMANQNLTEEQARSILEYFRTVDSNQQGEHDET